MIEKRRLEIGGDIILGHGSDLEQRNEIDRAGVDLPRDSEALLERRADNGAEWHAAPSSVKKDRLSPAVGAAMQQILGTCT